MPDDNFEEMARLRERYAELFLGFTPWPIGPWDGKKRSNIAKAGILKDVGEIIKERRRVLEEKEKNGKAADDGVAEDSDPLWYGFPLFLKFDHLWTLMEAYTIGFC